MIDSVEKLTTQKSVDLFSKFNIFTKTELESRQEVLYETYAKTINIEALTMIDMASKQFIPAVVRYTKSLADTVVAVQDAGADASAQRELLKAVSEKLLAMKGALEKLKQAEAKAGAISSAKEKAFYYRDEVKTAMEALRKPVDEAEMLVDREVWPVPGYGDLIFEV